MKTGMKHWTRLAQILLLCICTGANAGAHEIDAYLAAAQEFEKITAEKTAQGRMPRLEDKGVAALINTLSDNKRFLNPAADMDAVLNICKKNISIVMSYRLFDIKMNAEEGGDKVAVAEQIEKLKYKNILLFQDELEQLLPFTIRCTAVQVNFVTALIKTSKPEQFTETHRIVLRQARNGIFLAYVSAIPNIDNPDLKISYKEKNFQALAEAALPVASFLQPADRQKILNVAMTTQKTASDAMQENLRKIIDAMSAVECTGLCKL